MWDMWVIWDSSYLGHGENFTIDYLAHQSMPVVDSN